ncbi:hypothetical protein [Pendulispora albinea]|uniref:Uncharacterized protein n=1 Tax=Pendulispora albinea TaxID=2741071 RepID=A0ABZ2M461_9BACT
MKAVRSVDWEYTLLEGDGGERFIDVLCGTSALFARRVTLRPDEYQRALDDERYARELTLRIRREPAAFEGRYQDNPPKAFGRD